MKIKFLHLLLLSFVLFGCAEDNLVELRTSKSLTSFSFLRANNSELTYDIHLAIDGQLLKGNVPYNTEIDQLVASFDHNGENVTINNKVQLSGSTINDFTQIVNYQITAEDGSTELYQVDLVRFTGLPMFFITTDGGAEIDSKEDYVSGIVSLYGGRDFEDLDSDMKIRGRGNSTWELHPKKPYQMKLDEKTSILNMPADNKWIFLAEHSDKTLLRNKVAFELGYMSDLDWTPLSAYADVFVNQEYGGTYHVSQKVEAGVNKVNLKGTGYLLEIDQLKRLDPDDVYFYSSKFLLNIKEPEISADSEEFTYIKNYILNFEAALYGDDFSDPELGYEKYVDVDSFIDWYLISEITKNQDSRHWSSIFMNIIPGEKLKMGPIWDFDLAFGNVDYSECEYPTGFWVKDHAWIKRMFLDPNFVAKVKTRFLYFKNKQADILEIIDTNAAKLALSQFENNKKWDVLGNYVWPNSHVFDTYQEEVDFLKDWIVERMEWLDNAYKNL